MKKVLLKRLLDVLSTTGGVYETDMLGRKVFVCRMHCKDTGTTYYSAPITNNMIHFFGGVFEYEQSDFEKRIIIKDRDNNREYFFNEDWVEKWDVE